MPRAGDWFCWVTTGGVLIALAAGCCPKPPGLPGVLIFAGGESQECRAQPARLAERLTGRGEMYVQVTRDLSMLESPVLANYRVLVFDVSSQAELSESARRAVLDYVRSGGGLVAMHAALTSFRSWPEWAELVGGSASDHGRDGRYECLAPDPQHAAVLGLGGRFTLTDRPYLVDHLDPAAEVLVRSGQGGSGRSGGPHDGAEPLAWAKRVGNGRVFAIALGHDERSQEDEWFITLLHSGIRWAEGSLPDARQNVLTTGERQEGYELLFNGEDLSGWTGDTAHWTVEDGELVGRSDGLAEDAFLVAAKQYGGFVLRCSVRLPDGRGESGIFFRGHPLPGQAAQAYEASVGPGRWGSLFEAVCDVGELRVGGPASRTPQGGPDARPPRVLAEGCKGRGEEVVLADGWNELTIRAVGPRIILALNGLVTVDYNKRVTGTDARPGPIALVLRADTRTEVRFRDMRIKLLEKAAIEGPRRIDH
jgi:type 1 glutamine amidotransferase